jgi:hypothetical protein
MYPGMKSPDMQDQDREPGCQHELVSFLILADYANIRSQTSWNQIRGTRLRTETRAPYGSHVDKP